MFLPLNSLLFLLCSTFQPLLKLRSRLRLLPPAQNTIYWLRGSQPPCPSSPPPSLSLLLQSKRPSNNPLNPDSLSFFTVLNQGLYMLSLYIISIEAVNLTEIINIQNIIAKLSLADCCFSSGMYLLQLWLSSTAQRKLDKNYKHQNCPLILYFCKIEAQEDVHCCIYVVYYWVTSLPLA